ncbi:MAG: hypothetical protein HPY58_13255 [Firmicutes bacterium]|nr:hypothetical protein [Bacillota bacterium]
MSVFETVKSRYSVRDFDSPCEISEAQVQQLLEAVQAAPSAMNSQPWSVVVVREQETKQKIASAFPGNPAAKGILSAGVVLVACRDRSAGFVKDNIDYSLVDMGIAFQQMVLVAWEMGLGTCWVCGGELKKVAEVLGVPETHDVIAVFPIGKRQDVQARTKNRKDLAAFTHKERWCGGR